MTTLSFNQVDYSFTVPRAPRISFAARLAALQARHEEAPHLAAILGVATRATLALVPVATLAWVFVTI